MASVVVAEDNVEHQRAIAEVVRRLGHDVTVVADGREGLAAVTRQRPDLVVADVDMPRLNGLQLCRAIRDDDGLTDVPVVLVTAYLPPSDPELAAAGAAAVVRKPFTLRELTETLRAQLDGTTSTPHGDGQPATAPASPTGLGHREVTGEGAATRGFVDALLDSLDTGVVACDPTGRLVVFNEPMRVFFGDGSDAVSLDDWPQRFMLRHHDGSPLDPAELPLMRALAGESVQQAGMLAYDRRGRRRWLAINARPVREPTTGATLGAVAAMHDITSEHLAARYQDCKTEVLNVLAHTPDSATAGDEVLRAIATTLGWPYMRLWLVDPVVKRMRPVAIFTADGQQPLAIPDSIARGEGLAGLCWQRRELVWVPDVRAVDSPVLPEVASSSTYQAAGAVPLRSGENVIGVLTFFSHDRQEPEPALAVLLSGIAGNIGAYLEQRRAEELALQLAASTDEYISLVGHELRTPLTSIGTYTELIATSPDETTVGELRDLLDVIIRSNTRLAGLVEQLLDLAALESGHADLAVVPVDLTAAVEDAVVAMSAVVGEHRITVHTELASGVVVPGDPERLRQVVDHLLTNAVKYSPDGAAVTVTLTTDADGSAVLTVTDTGIGVPADEHPQLFRRLYRASNARHSGVPGAGLGLAFSRAIVERHGGTINLGAPQPTGTAVTVRLPTHR